MACLNPTIQSAISNQQSAIDQQSAISDQQSLSFRIKPPRVDARVNPVAIERRFFGGFRADRAPEAEGKFQSIDIAVVREKQTLLRRRCTRCTRCSGRCTGCTGCSGGCTGCTGCCGGRTLCTWRTLCTLCTLRTLCTRSPGSPLPTQHD